MKKLQNDSYPHQITVCVPIYNTERWLSQCLDSLVAQDIWEKIFIILVNDGSEDGSLKIAQQFSQDYPQKTLLLDHGENKGLLAARYSAIMRIETPFAMFVDSDDLLPSSACSDLYTVIIEKKADVIMGQMWSLNETNITKKPHMHKWFEFYGETDNLRLQGNFEIAGLPLCGKIYQSELLKATVHGKNGRNFPAISNGEDRLLSTAIFMKAKKIFITNKIIYHQRINYESMTHNINNDSVINYFFVSLNIWKLAIYYNCPKLAKQGSLILYDNEHRFFNSTLCFPYNLKILYIFSSMNKIARELGENFKISSILQKENQLIKEFGIHKLCDILEISEYKFYNAKIYYNGVNAETILVDSAQLIPDLIQTEHQAISSESHYRFHPLKLRKKIWSAAATLSKILKLYGKIRPFAKIFKYLFKFK